VCRRLRRVQPVPCVRPLNDTLRVCGGQPLGRREPRHLHVHCTYVPGFSFLPP